MMALVLRSARSCFAKELARGAKGRSSIAILGRGAAKVPV